jgi:PTS system ascorbate-specific IIC component
MALIAFFGLILNMLIARFTKLKFIFLSGHHTIFMSALCAVLLKAIGLSNSVTIIIGVIIIGLLSVVMPAISMPFMRKITGGDSIAMGHWATTSYVFSGFIGKVFGGDPEQTSTEDMEFPEWMSFFQEPVLLMGIGVFLVTVISSIFAGSDFVSDYSGDSNVVVWSLIQGFIFSAGVTVILTGVRMILAELVPAFNGIAEKIVPDAIPALDCPTVFTYAPNAVLIGFFGYTIGQLIAFLLFFPLGMTIIVPTLLHSFFMGGTSAVFGNATGGKRGAFLGSMFAGILNNMLSSWLFPVFGALGFVGTTFADTDFSVIGLLIYYIGKLFGLSS